MGTVNVNSATLSQLIVLLGLSNVEAVRVISARPFPTSESLAEALPERLASTPFDLDLPLIDINKQTADSVAAVAGLSQTAAERILAKRPYFLMSQLLSAAGPADFQKLLPYYTTPDFSYTDKLTGRGVSLDADPSQVIVSRANRPETEALAPTFAARRLFGPEDSEAFDVYAIPESESNTNVVAGIEGAYKTRAIPAFIDNRSSRRYLDPGFCIVQFKPEVDTLRAWAIMAELGLKLHQAHRTPGLYTLGVPGAQSDPSAMVAAIDGLNAHQEVKFAEPKYLGFNDREGSLAAGGVTSTGLPWNLVLTRIPEAWKTTAGSPEVVLAVIDTGVDMTHPAIKDALLSPAIGESFNFTTSGGPAPEDKDGHGTFITGILVGNGQDGVIGICPNCRVLPLKISLLGDPDSYATRRDAILFALQKVVPPQRLIINMSWKTTGDIGLIRDACDAAASEGALLIASAGNMPTRENEAHYPSDYPSVISVAAVTPDRRRADYSYFGDLVDVSAPGGDENDAQKNITSAALGGGTTADTGTSFAAPHVAGIAALTASVHPSLALPQLRFCIENGTDALSEPGLGRGLCNALKALQLSAGTPGSITGKLAGAAPAVPEGGTEPDNSVLQDLNTLDPPTLASRYGLAVLTAELIVLRRPIRSVRELQGVLGLTDQQLQDIENGSHA